MMTIQQLLNQSESKILEFKKDLSSPIPILKTLIAFANTAGGRLIIGINDDIEVESLGILVPGLTVEEMKQGTSRVRNHVIARVFRELNLIEQWGTGVRRIFEEAKSLSLPEPKIEEIGMRLRFTIFLAMSHSSNKASNIESGAQSEAQSEKILKALEKSACSATELMMELGLETKTGALKRAIKELLELGKIEYTIPDKPNSRLQKYRLKQANDK